MGCPPPFRSKTQTPFLRLTLSEGKGCFPPFLHCTMTSDGLSSTVPRAHRCFRGLTFGVWPQTSCRKKKDLLWQIKNLKDPMCNIVSWLLIGAVAILQF